MDGGGAALRNGALHAASSDGAAVGVAVFVGGPCGRWQRAARWWWRVEPFALAWSTARRLIGR